MRKTKQIKRKEVIYSIEEWEEIKRLAEIASLKTGTYIKRISLNGKINVIDLNEVTPVMNALRIIGNNINQIAKKANEINSIYAGDIEDLKENYEDICHNVVPRFPFHLQRRQRYVLSILVDCCNQLHKNYKYSIHRRNNFRNNREMTIYMQKHFLSCTFDP